MNKFIKLTLIFFLCLTLSSCKKKDLKIVLTSDIHYISKEICDFGPFFSRVLDSADGKITEYEEEIVEAFIDDVIEENPDVVVITGDLSFNGAKQSHEELAQRLRRLLDNDIKVLVLPGNHDVYSNMAAKFNGEEYEMVESAKSLDFYNIYADFGFKDALYEDEYSLSYVSKIDNNNWILMIDANSYANECVVKKETIEFIEDVLIKAQKEKVKVTVACHQNLFKHSNFDWGYVLINKDKLIDLFNKYDVNLFLSGHLHIQHYMEENGVTEICSESLMMTPIQYGVLNVNGDKFSYNTKNVNVKDYAIRNNLEDENLLDIVKYADERIAYTNKLKFDSRFSDDIENKEELLDLIGKVNQMYFSGDLTRVKEFEEEFAKLIDSNESVKAYVERIKKDEGKDYRRLSN
ncbi:MAG: metallophosphoesterase [Erysipelotrichaceae bacterium]|nr:metallophosphoesterase [Erysipelotrichaceae bacterium]